MKINNERENAADRKSYIGEIHSIGEKKVKEQILRDINPQWSNLHKEGYIHIHDLDAYGLTYNCLTFDILQAFPYEKFENFNDEEKIINVFDFIKELLSKVGNEQSGGMAFANFDKDFATIFTNLNITYENHINIFKGSKKSLILWCNNIHTRMGKTSYYVTFNVGLGTTEFARFLTSTFIECFQNIGNLIYKPNIVFKVHKGISRYSTDKNYDLLCKALLCTAKKMIPTYLLCDCEADKNINPEQLSIMGCRTRVVDDIFGKKGAIGRGNICNISINLPRIAFESLKADDQIKEFKKRWLEVASHTKDILIDRYEKTIKSDISLFPTNREYKLWCKDINKLGLSEVFKHGTLSIGFIGLSETIEILTGNKYWKQDNKELHSLAVDIVIFMRKYIDEIRDKYNLNFSLLATSGELISGRFVDIDKKIYKSHVLKKGFYTNSFHIDVDSKLPTYKKLELEGPLHLYSNGGCISYVELPEAPIGNFEGLNELIEIATNAGVHYLGFNFLSDICLDCGTTGTFDKCFKCNSKNIKRIRRVSGYLEDQAGFTSGKNKESKKRKAN